MQLKKRRHMAPSSISLNVQINPESAFGTAYLLPLLKTIIASEDGQEKDEMLEWLGGFYNPKTFDPNFVNRYLYRDCMDFIL